MKKIGAAKFKEQCLAILDRLHRRGTVINKRGEPVAQVMPFDCASADLIGALRGKIRVKGDIKSTGLKWRAGD